MINQIVSMSLVICLSMCNQLSLKTNKISYNIDSLNMAVSNTDQYKLLSALPDEGIKLFADSMSQYNGNYKKFMLNVKGKIVYFNWSNIVSDIFSPKMVPADVNDDDVKELVIILTIGTGTDLHIEEVHVLNLSTLEEITVVNPLDIIKEKVKTNIIKNESKVLIILNVGNLKTEITKDKNYTPIWFDNVGFGSEIYWKIERNKLYADVGAQVSPAGYIGVINIEYIFNNNKFIMKNIKFIQGS